jgi:hypothetical protein
MAVVYARGCSHAYCLIGLRLVLSSIVVSKVSAGGRGGLFSAQVVKIMKHQRAISSLKIGGKADMDGICRSRCFALDGGKMDGKHSYTMMSMNLIVIIMLLSHKAVIG